MIVNTLYSIFGSTAILAPLALLAVVGVPAVLGRPFGERLLARCTATAVIVGLVSAVIVLALMLLTGTRHVNVEFGNLVVIPKEHFHFHLLFVFDRLSVPFSILSFVLVGATGAFASRYLHREPGYGRFFVLYALFLLGMILASLAGTIEAMFLGWELVGLSSALLVAFFHERPWPVRNGQRVWSVYRVSDAAFLLAAIVLHHLHGEGDLTILMGTGPWPEATAALTPGSAFLVGFLFLLAAAGKSALVPFSGWLPRAMEGPTPSSAIFYGALSVHLGVFLLLRISPILELSPPLCALIVLVGLATAGLGAITASIQTDVKSSLAFASVTQVGIIAVEIGLGLRYIALIHIIGHASLRTLQLLRAPSVLHDYHSLEDAIGDHLNHESTGRITWLPTSIARGVYRFGLERGQLDAVINEYVVLPFIAAFRWCDRMERRWTDFLTGMPSRESDQIPVASPPEDFAP